MKKIYIPLLFSGKKGWGTFFDQGNASSIVEEDGKFRITPYRYTAGNTWVLFSIRSNDFAGKTPHFLVARANRYGGNPATTENMAVWSTAADTDTWYKFDNQTIGASDIEFYNNTPFPGGMIYVSYLPLYPLSRVERVFNEWLTDPRTTTKIAGYDNSRLSRDGRTVPTLPIYGLLVTNNSGYTKKNMILTAGNHPNETEGMYQLEGAMSWLLGGSVEAEFLLDYFNIYVYPCINPQGLWAGYTRSGPQHYDAWHGDFTTPPTFGVSYDDIDILKAAMSLETGEDIEVGIDFHGTVGNNVGYMSVPDHTVEIYARLLALISSQIPNFSFVDETLGYTLPDIWRDNYSAAISAHIEGGAKSTISIPSNWKTQGQVTTQSLTTMLAEGRFANGPGVGSRDFNGTTDRIDWSNVFNTVSAITVSYWVYIDAVAHVSYIFASHRSDNGAFAEICGLAYADATHLTLFMNGLTSTVALQRASNSILTSTLAGAWHHIVTTWDGSLTAANVHIYLDNSEVTYGATVNGTGTLEPGTGLWSLGGRYYDDARNLDGKIAQLAVWDRVLNSTEIANLAAGYAPDLVDGGSNLKFYFKGNTSSLVASPGGTGTADGTTSVTGVGNGPSIIYG